MEVLLVAGIAAACCGAPLAVVALASKLKGLKERPMLGGQERREARNSVPSRKNF